MHNSLKVPIATFSIRPLFKEYIIKSKGVSSLFHFFKQLYLHFPFSNVLKNLKNFLFKIHVSLSTLFQYFFRSTFELSAAVKVGFAQVS